MRSTWWLGAALAAAALGGVAAPAEGQRRTAEQWLEECRSGRWGSSDRERYCDVREQTIPARSSVRVDGHDNGGIAVIGWDRNEILVRAKVLAYGGSEREAREIAEQIRIETDPDIRATGPNTERRSSWSVSYEVYVPHRIDLELSANNGGIDITDVNGRMSFSTSNGGISLSGVSGNVRGTTTNGGIDVRLSGDRWQGEGLDLRTTNGGVEIAIPERYNARLKTGTVNGGMDIEFPITVEGRIDRRLTTQLGDGGPLIKATTTNGGVTLRRM